MPSRTNTSCRTALASGSSPSSSRSPCWTTVTCTPNRANTCANSHPIGPPPSTTSEPGSPVTCTASRLVQYGVSASPSTGGAAGRVPGLSTTPLLASNACSSPSLVVTTTRRAPSSRPTPCSTVAPAPSSRSTATRSSQWSVACTETRSATGAQLLVTLTSPDSSPARPASATRSAARTIILVGMHP